MLRPFIFLLALQLLPYFCFADINISSRDKILILSPHPDDEILAAGGLIQCALSAGAQLKIVYFTNGDYNELSHFLYKKRPALSRGGFIQIGKTRQLEAYQAMQSLSLKESNLVFLGYPDRFTEAILTSFWNKDKPPASFLTHISRVPYEDAPSFGAPYVGQSILRDLKNILIAYRPTKVFVSSPQDTNPDHRSLYVYVKVALLDLQESNQPEVFIYLVHRASWPTPKKYLPAASLTPPASPDKEIKWDKFWLSKGEVEKKRNALLCYKSQLTFDKNYLLAFIRRNELFYYYPEIDLRKGKSVHTAVFNSKLVSHIMYSRDKKFFYINIRFNRQIAQSIKADIYLLGYRKDLEFSLMPKIFLKAKGSYKIAYNKRKMISVKAVGVKANRSSMSIKFPLYILDYPDCIFNRIILKGKIFALHIAPWSVIRM